MVTTAIVVRSFLGHRYCTRCRKCVSWEWGLADDRLHFGELKAQRMWVKPARGVEERR